MASLLSLQPDQIFAGRYRVVRLVKAGGMGAVYEVRHTSNDKRWALKIMHPELARHTEARERFAREAKVDALIDSAFVVSVIDAGVDEPTETPFLVMEFLVGEELGDRIARGERCTPEQTVRYLGQIAKALDKAHAKGIIHRDLKPENLFLCQSDDEGEKVKILDFGIAKLLESTSVKTTQSGGTPLYMAPEQTRKSRDIGPWTDIWALGLIAYTLLVGKSYWEADTIGELFGEILSADAREPASVRGRHSGVALPPSFDAWFMRCIDGDPKKRFSRAGEAVAGLADALGVAAPVVGVAPALPFAATAMAPPIIGGSTTAPHVGEASKPTTSGKRAIGAAVAIIVVGMSVIGLGVGWSYWKQHHSEAVASPSDKPADDRPAVHDPPPERTAPGVVMTATPSAAASVVSLATTGSAYARADRLMQEGHLTKAREALDEKRIIAGGGTPDEVMLLKAICEQLGARDCVSALVKAYDPEGVSRRVAPPPPPPSNDRKALERRVFSGQGTEKDAKFLLNICKAAGDAACIERIKPYLSAE